MSVALLLIATGEKYFQYIRPLLDSANRYFVPHTPLLFTDSTENFGVPWVEQENLGYPGATLNRYHIFLSKRTWIEQFDYAFYLDIDALFVDYVKDDILSEGITATLHHNKHPQGLLESNPKSTAYLASSTNYYCGGFNGGSVKAYLSMAETIRQNIDIDSRNGIVAKWHDESHLNRYLNDIPPSKILSSDYCYPEPDLHEPCSPKIICLDKSLRGGR